MNAAFVDTDLRHTWIHNSAPEPPEEAILGKTDAELFDADVAEPTMEIKRKAIETESRVENSFTFIKPWGQNRYRAAAKPLYDDGENVEGAMFAAIDLSDRYRFLERTSDAVYTVDSDWTVTFWNDRMAERTGIEAREIVGKNLWETFGKSIPESLEERYRSVMETGETAEFEQYLPEPFDYWVEIRVFSDDDGLSIFSRDISERKEQEDRLKSQRDTLDTLNQVLRHDIRNDLQLVLAYADLLADQLDDEDYAQHAETISQNAKHAVDLTTTAREITEALFSETGTRTRMSLRSVLEGEIDTIRNGFDDAVIEVDWPIPDVVVMADEMLDSVFRNLLKNAIQHNDKEFPQVTVSTEEYEDEIEIRIADNGPGIPDSQKEDVFASGEKGLESMGSGIGLYLVQTLVENYNGEVWIEDNEPEGAVFVVRLIKVQN